MAAPSIFTPEINQYIIDNIDNVLYKDMADEIENKFGRRYTPKQLGGRANNMGLKQFRPKQYNRNFFDNLNSTEKGYWLGFIYADGWVCRSKLNAELGIELAVVDTSHLQKFLDSLGDTTTEIITEWKPEGYIKSIDHTIKSSETSRIRLFSMGLVDGLISHDVHLRKTYEEKSPSFKYSDEVNLAIIRGFYDGDGGIDANGQLKFTAYRVEFLLKLQKYLSDKYGVEGRVFKEERAGGETHVHRFTIHSSSAKKFLDILYQDMSYSYLDRKYKRYQEHYLE